MKKTKGKYELSRDKAIELYKKGLQVQQIAKVMNRAKSTVHNYLSGLKGGDNYDQLGKGKARVSRNEKIYKSLPSVKKGTRPVKIPDIKNTVIYVGNDLTDKEAIDRYLEKRRIYLARELNIKN